MIHPDQHENLYRNAMGVEEAVQATKWIKPKFAVAYAKCGACWYPPFLEKVAPGTPEDFLELLKKENPLVQGLYLKPGDTWYKNEGLKIRRRKSA